MFPKGPEQAQGFTILSNQGKDFRVHPQMIYFHPILVTIK